MNRWRRPLLVIALLLLGGAVMNVAVAWVHASRIGYLTIVAWGVRPSAMEDVAWTVRKPLSSWPSTCRREIARGFGYEFHREFGRADDFWTIEVQSQRYGLPFLALRHDTESFSSLDRLPGTASTPIPEWHPHSFEIPVPRSLGVQGSLVQMQGTLPHRPILPGFALNTLFYAAILALPLSVFSIRRRLRARRGRCPKCGYDLAGVQDAPCPECGARRRPDPSPRGPCLQLLKATATDGVSV